MTVTELSGDIMLTRGEDAIRLALAAGATAADAVLIQSTDVSVSVRMGKQESLERAESAAIGLRVFIGQSQAIVSSTDWSSNALQELVTQAIAMAKIAPPDPFTTLAPAALLASDVPELDLYDAYEPHAERLLESCKHAEDAALSVSGVTNSNGADASYHASTVGLITSHGFSKSYRSSHSSLSASVIAGTGTEMERDYDYSSARHYADLTPAGDIGASAGARAVRRLNARKIGTSRVPIIFDPRLGKSLLSNFAGAISGSAIARESSFLKEDMGKRVFNEHVTIMDDPHRLRGLGSKPFDDEGVANRQQMLVDKGELKTWLLDVRSAAKLGLVTTGNASRGIASGSSPSATNLYMANGLISKDAMIRDIKQGLYITEAYGMGVNLVTGDYSQGASGMWIENGELAYPVSEITIAGNLRSMFQSLTPADDLEFRYATNTPTLRIEGMTVAGK